MKKVSLLSSGGMIIFFCLLSMTTNINNATDYPLPDNVIDCAVTGSAVSLSNSARPFTTADIPTVVMVRKNVYSLTAGEIASIKTGITNMKALPHTDPTSWIYQAAIHGTTLTDNLPSWKTCHQPGASFFFLAWHRMYCYFFERVLRAKSGDPNLTLPYWNYQTNAVLHPEYRNNAAGNPLYDASRFVTINSGGTLPASISTAINNALLEVPYYDFQSSINGPHGSVHSSVDGNMGSVNTAALDPLFWLHHCNIDRLWEVWLRKCGGRKSPVDAAWLNKTYTFFDETGAAINMTGSQVVNTATQLNYRYDFSPVKKYCPPLSLKWWVYKRWPIIKWPIPYAINNQLLKRSFREARVESVDNFVKERNKSRFNFNEKDAPDKLIIELENVRVEKAPEGVVEVYLNLGANERPNPGSKSFVGLLDLFSISHANTHANMRGMENEMGISLNASKAAKALNLTIADLKKAEITFYVRGNSLRGKEVATTANIRAEALNLSIEMAEK